MAVITPRYTFTADELQRMAQAGIFTQEDELALVEGNLVELHPPAGEKHMFTVDEYYRMAEVGIFGEDDRVELIEGDIVAMSPIGGRHAGCVKQLIVLLTPWIGKTVLLGVQDPIRLGGHSEPQPDLALLRPREDSYRLGHPGPGDVLLLIEVADTSAADDRKSKVPVYARAGILEVWLIDLSGEVIEVYSRPEGGKYRRTRRVRRGEQLAARAIPGLVLSVDEILGPTLLP